MAEDPNNPQYLSLGVVVKLCGSLYRLRAKWWGISPFGPLSERGEEDVQYAFDILDYHTQVPTKDLCITVGEGGYYCSHTFFMKNNGQSLSFTEGRIEELAAIVRKRDLQIANLDKLYRECLYSVASGGSHELARDRLKLFLSLLKGEGLNVKETI